MKFQFQQSYGRNLGMAYTAVTRQLSKYLKEKNLPITPDQFRVLTQLWENDGCSQQELAKGSDRDRANVTRIIDILEREGLVARNNHETDRRIYRISLTPKGKDLETEAAECAKLTLKDALDGIDEEDLATCMRVLKKTMDNLK
jgi:DNA-binding MarR family transcriptional regulator